MRLPELRRKLLCLSVTVLLACAPLNATTFILVRVGNKLYIGADGYRVNYVTGLPGPHCKIAKNNKVITLTWGVAGYGADRFVDRVAPISASLKTVIQKRELLIPKAKQFQLRMMQLIDLKGPVSDADKAKYNIGAAFISMKHGTPQIGAFQLTIVDWEKREIRLDRFPVTLESVFSACYGNHQACGDNNIPETTPEGLIRMTLERQHELTPNDVGPPYSIAVLSASGLEWIEKGACQQ